MGRPRFARRSLQMRVLARILTPGRQVTTETRRVRARRGSAHGAHRGSERVNMGNPPLTVSETEAIRRAFAELRALASGAEVESDRQTLRDFCRRLAPPGRHDGMLSEREVDVLAHAATGLHNGEIADALDLSPETVKSYLRSSLVKLGAHSRQEAVDAARRAELLP
ncbi:DNA-binding response regulator [Prescottella agglutinans]|uniref:DNA-binding response regulator n=2 Tax=Prescottella agglutinans TaxID=1644129 RepID=A0A3S3EAV8_9NOCA|nr:DNA-binding response regulator [Prescottella agglutinans]